MKSKERRKKSKVTSHWAIISIIDNFANCHHPQLYQFISCLPAAFVSFSSASSSLASSYF